jgi:hypothetical protein
MCDSSTLGYDVFSCKVTPEGLFHLPDRAGDADTSARHMRLADAETMTLGEIRDLVQIRRVRAEPAGELRA